MTLPAQIAILQRFRSAAWLPGTFFLQDQYELVTIAGAEVSPPLCRVRRTQGFCRRSYQLELEGDDTYRLVNRSSLLRFRWQLTSPTGEPLGTVSSSVLRPGYRILVEAAGGELSARPFKVGAVSAEVEDRFGLRVARIEAHQVAVPGRGLIQYRLRFEETSAHRPDLRLLIAAGVIAKLKVGNRTR